MARLATKVNELNEKNNKIFSLFYYYLDLETGKMARSPGYEVALLTPCHSNKYRKKDHD